MDVDKVRNRRARNMKFRAAN